MRGSGGRNSRQTVSTESNVSRAGSRETTNDICFFRFLWPDVKVCSAGGKKERPTRARVVVARPSLYYIILYK